ncbi:hypothetical protein AB0J83_30400 [Actinoplanes sp. NPDC049596]|uniref:hypothetical protein n=1 Tax=unclassified Actinoplanes TaxID=2626549 RepID=UPI00342B5D01
MTNSFDAAVARRADDNGWSRLRTADVMVDAWSSFVAQCSQGYDMSIYEYENDLSVRSMIERLLTDEELAGFPEFAGFAARVAEIDARFRALLQEGVEIRDSAAAWWERGVPRMAGAELAEDFHVMFGVTVQEAPGR